MRRAAVLLATLAFAGVAPPAGADDSTPTQWQLDAHAEALQYAPEPEVKPVICIVDFGVTPTPDLDIVHRQALDGGTLDDVTATPGNFGHGTTVAHMAAGKVNGWGASGVFPHARIASVRIFSAPGELVPWQRYVNALHRCRDSKPTPVVATLSIGGATATPQEIADLSNTIEATRTRYDMSVVAAAGNSSGLADMPARLQDTFSVTGSDSTGGLCGFSARSENIDLMAPGCDLHQSGWDGEPWSVSGTSFAAPAVAGALAALRAYRQELTAGEAEELLVETATAGPFPQLNVRAAMREAGVAALANDAGSPPSAELAAGATSPASASPEPERKAAPVPVTPASARSDTPSPLRGTVVHRPKFARLRRPRVRVVGRRGHSLVFRFFNRPPGSRAEIRVGRRCFVRARSRASAPLRGGSIRIRFVDELRTSPWVKLSVPPRGGKER